MLDTTTANARRLSRDAQQSWGGNVDLTAARDAGWVRGPGGVFRCPNGFTEPADLVDSPKTRGRRPALSPEQRDEVRALIAQGYRRMDLAARFGVSRSTVDNIAAERRLEPVP